MHTQYVELRDGGYYLAGVRVSLDSIVHSFIEGQSPETIQENFPLLKLSQIYGAVAYYLDHQNEIDRYLEQTRRDLETHAVPMAEANPALWKKVQRSKSGA